MIEIAGGILLALLFILCLPMIIGFVLVGGALLLNYGIFIGAGAAIGGPVGGMVGGAIGTVFLIWFSNYIQRT